MADHGSVTIEAASFDARSALPDALSRLRPHLMIDATGPFQGRDYGTVQTCIAAGVHYADLADASAFVNGIGALDTQARQAGVLALSGVSSVPGLSSSVVADLRPSFVALDTIAIGITPGNRAPRGLAVVTAILSYTGRPIRCLRDGRWTHVHGWQDLRRHRIEGLGTRWFAACDVPDLALLPARYPELQSVTFHAGLELSVLHLGLWLLSWPARWRLLPNLPRLARPMRTVASWLESFGTDRGGMFVTVHGTDCDGRPMRRTWHMTASTGHGPFVPCCPSAIVARKLADRFALNLVATGPDDPLRPGARPCFNAFTPADFMDEVADLGIHCKTVDSHG